ncbi:histone H1-like [Musca domestica]|uniref:Histone H1-like n=1 Tax=Musca domestica TaxID=7370 RepID=A0ABM3VJZ6_MUSDO|nr:histone H1-like [Musca domestica]
MSDAAVVEATASPVALLRKGTKKAAAKAKKPSAAPTHPPTQQMVDAAIKTLKERGGSSLPAIKKYLASTYKVDAQKWPPSSRIKAKPAKTAAKASATKPKAPKAKTAAAKPKKAAAAKKPAAKKTAAKK